MTKGTPRKLKEIKGTVLSLLTGGAGNNNYWHWLYDVLPRLSLCSKIEKLETKILPKANLLNSFSQSIT